MIYIELFHGRKPGEELHDWGTQGPVFRSPGYFHTTYASEIKFGEDGNNVLTIVGGADETVSSCVYYDGMYYGDWSVFSPDTFKRAGELQNRLAVFDQTKARVPSMARRTAKT
jgi:hypothetical protein